MMAYVVVLSRKHEVRGYTPVPMESQNMSVQSKIPDKGEAIFANRPISRRWKVETQHAEY